MRINEKTKYEIEAKASSMSDFLKMEYLEECLRQNFSFDIKKYCSSELANLYENRKMFSEAAKKMEHIGEISVTFREKKGVFMKAVELYVKSGLYDKAEFDLKKALDCGDENEKKQMKKAYKKLLKQQAEVYEKENRKGHTLKAYEKLYKISDENEKIEVKEKLLMLYQQLGKISEYNILKGG